VVELYCEVTIPDITPPRYARSPRGPWSAPRIVLRNNLNPTKSRSDWDYYVTNPTASMLPNGTVMLVSQRVWPNC
jgi:hypothetical protein